MNTQRFAAAVIVAVLSLGGVALTAIPSWADVCVPSDGTPASDVLVEDVAAYEETVVDVAAHWQRYSWTGGPHASDEAPAFPSADWQANVQGDPHGIGVAGAYFRSHGNSGNGDWFYLEWVPEVSHVEHHDAVTHVEHIDGTDPVVCDVVTPPDDDPTPPATAPPAPEKPQELAFTAGHEPSWWLLGPAALLLLLGAKLFGMRSRIEQH